MKKAQKGFQGREGGLPQADTVFFWDMRDYRQDGDSGEPFYLFLIGI